MANSTARFDVVFVFLLTFMQSVQGYYCYGDDNCGLYSLWYTWVVVAIVLTCCCVAGGFYCLRRWMQRQQAGQAGQVVAPPNEMSSTTQKQRNFAAEPMGNKMVDKLPGIGKVLAGRLTKKYPKAYFILGHFLILGKSEKLFCEWLTEECRATASQSEECYTCLCEWCNSFL